MTSYKPGDIIFVNVAFSGEVGYKRRPVVVISNDSFNKAGVKLVAAGITSNITSPFRPGDTLLNDWETAGLIKPSAVRGVLATVDRLDILRKLGVMSEADFKQVMRNIKSILEFEN